MAKPPFVPQQTGDYKFCIVCGQGSHRLDWQSNFYPMCDSHTDEDIITTPGPVGWFGFRKGVHMGTFVPPDDLPKLVFNQQVYDSLPMEKRQILYKLKKQTAAQGVNDTCTIITWYLDPVVFVEITTKYPWLLDSNMGEPVVNDFWSSLP